LRPEETSPADPAITVNQSFTDLRNMAVRGIEDRIDNKSVTSSQRLKLFKVRNHGLRRTSTMPCAFNERIRAVTASMAASPLGLNVEHASGPQIVSGDVRGPVGRFE
jgi:hypothetical protein